MQCSQHSMNLNNRKIDILFSRDLGYGYCYFTVPLTFVRGVVGCLFGCDVRCVGCARIAAYFGLPGVGSVLV